MFTLHSTRCAVLFPDVTEKTVVTKGAYHSYAISLCMSITGGGVWLFECSVIIGHLQCENRKGYSHYLTQETDGFIKINVITNTNANIDGCHKSNQIFTQTLFQVFCG